MYNKMVIIVLLSVAPAFAVPVCMELNGTISSHINNPILGEAIPIGTPFVSRLKYDTDLIDSSSSSSGWTNYYLSENSEYSITVGDYTFHSSSLRILVELDTFIVWGLDNTIFEEVNWGISLNFQNDSEQILDSTSLPASPLVFDDWSYARMKISNQDVIGTPGNPSPSIFGDISSITPEPASFALLAIGGVVVVRRR